MTFLYNVCFKKKNTCNHFFRTGGLVTLTILLFNVPLAGFTAQGSTDPTKSLSDTAEINTDQSTRAEPQLPGNSELVAHPPPIQQQGNETILKQAIDWVARTIILSDKKKYCYICRVLLPNCLCYCLNCKQYIHSHFRNQTSGVCLCHTQGPSDFQWPDRLPDPPPKHLCEICLAYADKQHRCLTKITLPQEFFSTGDFQEVNVAQSLNTVSPGEEHQNPTNHFLPPVEAGTDILDNDLLLSDDSDTSVQDDKDTFFEQVLNDLGERKILKKHHKKILKYIGYLDSSQYDHFTRKDWLKKIKKSKLALNNPCIFYLYPPGTRTLRQLGNGYFLVRFCGEVEETKYIEQGILIIRENEIYFIIANICNTPIPYTIKRGKLIKAINRLIKYIDPEKQHYIIAIKVKPPKKFSLSKIISDFYCDSNDSPQTITIITTGRQSQEENTALYFSSIDNYFRSYYYSIISQMVHQWFSEELQSIRVPPEKINAFRYESNIQGLVEVISSKTQLSPDFLQETAAAQQLEAHTVSEASFRLFILMTIDPTCPPVLTGYSFFQRSQNEAADSTDNLREICVILKPNKNIVPDEYTHYIISFDEFNQYITDLINRIATQYNTRMKLFPFYLTPIPETNVDNQ